MDRIVDTLTGQFILYAPRIAVGLVIFIVFWVASRLAARFVVKMGEKAGVEPHVLGLLGQVARISLVALGVVSALGTAGVNVSALVASLGLVGFALGFALKDAVSNILAGVLILVYSPFRVGEEVEVAGYKGKVVNIDLRYTTIDEEGESGATVLVPNSTLYTKPIRILGER